MHTLAVELEPAQFLAGWRPEPRLLFVPALSEARPGDPVAVQVTVSGHPIRATVFGRVSSVRRVGRPSLPPGAELTIDAGSLPALGFLAAAARGDEVTFREREPRWIVKRTWFVRVGAASVKVATVNVSSRGCAIEWGAALPRVGETVRLQLGDGLLAPAAEAVVCWGTLGRRSGAVGLRRVTEGRGGRAWRNVASDAERAGASSV